MNNVLNYDCLGCLMDALSSGEIDQETYEDILRQQKEIDEMKREYCPGCQKPGYVSMYEPEVMHCPACGLYSIRIEGTWQPFRQGIAIKGEVA